MIRSTIRAVTRTSVILLASLVSPATASAQTADVRVEEVSPRVYRVHDSTASLVVFAAHEQVVVVGAQRPALVARARALLEEIGSPPVRYALAMEHDGYGNHADGGWAADGVITLTHEMLYADMRRLRRSRGGAAAPESPGAELPSIGFSQVVQLFVPGEEVHIVHSRPGTSWSDVIVHFHRSGLAFLGSVFTADGYPSIDPERGASIPGLMATVGFFIENFADSPDRVEPIVPARGPVGTLADLAEYREMLSTVQTRITALLQGGMSVDEVVAARPTTDLDARWGQGPVTPDRFTAAVAETLRPRAGAPSGHGHH